MDTYRRLCLFFFIIPLCFSCSLPQSKKITRAYYFWRMSEPTQEERNFLKEHRIEKLYVHLLDVDWSPTQGAIPVTQNELQLTHNAFKWYDSFPKQLVPVIFITNKTFELIDSAAIHILAQRLVRRCLPAYDSTDRSYEERNFIRNNGGTIAPKEIQFDCDWTIKTKSKYFHFLNEIKKLLPDSVLLSATIRLHQYKYPSKTGVPPVDRGMLMVYNISDPKQYAQSNSIFDQKKAAAYFTSNQQYPFPLDIVLPAWSWCIVYRDQQFYQVENELIENDLKSASFLKPTGNHRYMVTQDTVYHDLFLRIGDEIKAENVDVTQLKAATQLSRKAVNTGAFTVSLFELSQKEFQQYNDEAIDEVYTSFH
jgi:hypothetical protein